MDDEMGIENKIRNNEKKMKNIISPFAKELPRVPSRIEFRCGMNTQIVVGTIMEMPKNPKNPKNIIQ
jgi:hypothetical protein